MSGLQLKQMIESPIKGTKGNVEYLAEFGVLREVSEILLIRGG